MSEPEMMDLYRKWAAEKVDPLREEITRLGKAITMMRDMIMTLADYYEKSEIDEADAVRELINGIDAEIEALWLRKGP